MTLMKLMLIFLGLGINAEDKYTKLYNIVCETSPKWTENVTCGLKVVGRNIVVANMEMDIKQAFKNISIHFTMFKFYSQFRPFLINVTFNACDVFKKKGPSNFFNNLSLRILSKYSNVVKCPLEGHLYARRLEVKYEYLKFFLEDGKYRLNFDFFEGYPFDPIGTALLYIEVTNKYVRPTKKSVT